MTTKSNLASIQGKTILVTGGAGLIGSHIVDLCLDEGAKEVRVFDDFSRGTIGNLESAAGRGGVRVIEGDIRDLDQLRPALDGVDVLFHQAAIRITRCAAEPRVAFEVLGEGAFNVFEQAVEAGVSKVVAASTASVYGMAQQFPTSEEHHPYGNRTLYGALKVLNEGLLRTFHESNGLDYVALRYFNVYGPRMDVHGVYTEVMIRWIHRIRDGLAPVVFGSGEQSMDFVFVEDIARANLLAAKSNISDEVFNVASGTETTLLELAQLLLEIMGSDLTPEHAEERKVNAVARRLADTEKARRLLGFEAQVDLATGLRRLVDWVDATGYGEDAQATSV